MTGTGEAFVCYGDSERAEGKPRAECGPPFRPERMVASREVKIRRINDTKEIGKNDMRPNPEAGLGVRVAAREHDQWPFGVNLPCEKPLI